MRSQGARRNNNRINAHVSHRLSGRAVDMLLSGHCLTDIRNHLGHDNIQSTTIYLHLDLNRRRQIQKQLVKHMESVLTTDLVPDTFF